MAKVGREGFTLNPANPRDKIIIDFLKNQFNKSDFMKDTIYDYIVSNDLQIITQPTRNKHVINTIECIKDDVNITTSTQQDDVIVNTSTQKVHDKVNTSTRKNSTNVDKDFSIDLSAIDDEEVNITTDVEKEDATANAMNFLSQM